MNLGFWSLSWSFYLHLFLIFTFCCVKPIHFISSSFLWTSCLSNSVWIFVVKFYIQSSSSLHDGHPDVVLSFLIVKFAKISKCLKELKLICEYWSHQPEWLWLVKNFILVAEATIRGLTRLMQQGTVPNHCGPVKTGVTTANKKEQAAWLASVLSHLFLEY